MRFHAFRVSQIREGTLKQTVWQLRSECCSDSRCECTNVTDRNGTTYVCPVIVIERIELLTSKLVLQLQGMVAGDVCELVERVGVVYMGYRSRGVGVDDGAEI